MNEIDVNPINDLGSNNDLGPTNDFGPTNDLGPTDNDRFNGNDPGGELIAVARSGPHSE